VTSSVGVNVTIIKDKRGLDGPLFFA